MRLGPFEFDARTGELRSGAGIVRLEPQPAAVLALLASRPGELVTHDEIRRAIWGDATHVNFQQSLHYCIRQIRMALGDNSRQPAFIETMPRRGYRLNAAAERIAPVPAPTAESAATFSSAGRGRRWMAWTAVAALLTAAVVAAEQRPNRHHEIAMTLLKAVHAFVY